MSEPADVESGKAVPERPDELLCGVALPAWQAYNAMETTKRRHFEFLEILDNRQKHYNIQASKRDQQLLAYLLRDHDEQVKRFTDASMSLKEHDAQAHAALFLYIGSLNQLADASRVTH